MLADTRASSLGQVQVISRPLKSVRFEDSGEEGALPNLTSSTSGQINFQEANVEQSSRGRQAHVDDISRSMQ